MRKFIKEKGAVDIVSVLFGVALMGILVAIGVVGYTLLTPWVQDEKVKQELSVVTDAQNLWIAQHRSASGSGDEVQSADLGTLLEDGVLNGYTTADGSTIISSTYHLCVYNPATPAGAWVAEIRSDSGKYFRITSEERSVVEISEEEVTCLDIVPSNNPNHPANGSNGGESTPPADDPAEGESGYEGDLSNPENEDNGEGEATEDEEADESESPSSLPNNGIAIYAGSPTQTVEYDEIIYDWSNQVMEVRNLTITENGVSVPRSDWTILVNRSVYPYNLVQSVEYNGSWQVDSSEDSDFIYFTNKWNSWAPNNPQLASNDSFSFSPRFHLRAPLLSEPETFHSLAPVGGNQWYATQQVTITTTSMLKGRWSAVVDLSALNAVRPLNNVSIQNGHVYGIEHISGTEYRIYSTTEQLWTLPDYNTPVTVVIVSG